jgi:hypothetical protein
MLGVSPWYDQSRNAKTIHEGNQPFTPTRTGMAQPEPCTIGLWRIEHLAIITKLHVPLQGWGKMLLTWNLVHRQQKSPHKRRASLQT